MNVQLSWEGIVKIYKFVGLGDQYDITPEIIRKIHHSAWQDNIWVIHIPIIRDSQVVMKTEDSTPTFDLEELELVRPYDWHYIENK